MGLLHLGMEKGDRLGIWSPNKYEWITTQFASALAGFILVKSFRIKNCFSGKCEPNVPHRRSLLCRGKSWNKNGKKFEKKIKKISHNFQLICPPEFKRSDYYGILCDLIPELETAPAGDGRVSTDTFPKLRNLIIFDTAQQEKKRTFNGAWSFEHVLGMGNAEDRRRLDQIEASVQPDDPANIQYTSVGFFLLNKFS